MVKSFCIGCVFGIRPWEGEIGRDRQTFPMIYYNIRGHESPGNGFSCSDTRVRSHVITSSPLTKAFGALVLWAYGWWVFDVNLRVTWRRQFPQRGAGGGGRLVSFEKGGIPLISVIIDGMDVSDQRQDVQRLYRHYSICAFLVTKVPLWPIRRAFIVILSLWIQHSTVVLQWNLNFANSNSAVHGDVPM